MIETLSVYFERGVPDWHVPSSRIDRHIFLLLAGGAIEYTVDGVRHPLRKGDVLFIPQGSVRGAINGSGQPFAMYAAHFRYAGDGEELPLLMRPTPLRAAPFAFDYLKQRFSALTQAWLRKSARAETICHAALLEMLAHVQEEVEPRALPPASYKLVMTLQEELLSRYREPIRIAELAAKIERTPNYTSTIFKQATGRTITEYVQQLRISAACDLLAHSKMSVGEISDYLGFCEPSYFNRVFKKVTGALPSTYLKEQIKLWRGAGEQGPPPS